MADMAGMVARLSESRTRGQQSAAMARARAATGSSRFEQDARRKFRVRSEQQSQSAAVAVAAARVVAAIPARAVARLSPSKACRETIKRWSPAKRQRNGQRNGSHTVLLKGGPEDGAPTGDDVVHGDAARRVAADSGAEVVPVGARVSIYWEGADDWYEAAVVSHTVVLAPDGDSLLSLQHKCASPSPPACRQAGACKLPSSVAPLTSRLHSPHLQCACRRRTPRGSAHVACTRSPPCATRLCFRVERRCEYENGIVAHDFAVVPHEVVDWPMADDGGVGADAAAAAHGHNLRPLGGGMGLLDMERTREFAQENLENAQLAELLSTRIREKHDQSGAKPARTKRAAARHGGIAKRALKRVAKKCFGRQQVMLTV